MRIPENALDRITFVLDMIEKCSVSISDRRSFYERMRGWFISGSDTGEPARFNKMAPHIGALVSYLYAADSTRFTAHLGAAVPERELLKTSAMERLTEDAWSNTNADMLFSEAVRWSLVYGSMFVKLSWLGGLEMRVVSPRDVGVLREDIPSLANQEAFIVRYPITKSELIDKLYSHPARERIIEKISFGATEEVEPTPMDRIILSASSPNMIGNAPLSSDETPAYAPQVQESTAQITELFVWDDEASDWRIFVVADPDTVIYDRAAAEVFVKGETGVVQVLTDPLPDYFWGASEVYALHGLQDMVNTRIDEILRILAKQAKPPKVFSGFDGILDEKANAMDDPGGFVFSAMSGARVEPLTPTVTSDMYQFLEQIDQMFAEVSGMGSILMGEGAKGVRSASQAAQLAKMGGSRAKKRAMLVEDALEKIATLVTRVFMQHDDSLLLATDGSQFAPAQFTKDFVMRVDAHSNSPLFVDDNRALAFNLFKAAVISPSRFVEMVNPPMKYAILQELKQAEQKAAAQQQEAPQEAPSSGQKSPKVAQKQQPHLVK